MYFRYSSIVVAPMSWISPRAKEGFRMLEASMAPSAPPAPMIVWSSSMKRRTSWLSSASLMTRLIRSSNSPRYLLPATILAISRVRSLRFCKGAGTAPMAIRWARPSTMAVFPTPGSPTRQGLFLVRRLRISMIRSISCSLPTTGSSFPSSARAVRSRLYCSRVGVFPPSLRFAFLAPWFISR